MSAAGGRITAGVGANLIGQHAQDRNQEATVYCGNLDPQMTEELVWELFIQAGPLVNVYLPKDRVTNNHQGYGFVEFRTEEDADYAVKVLNMIKVYGKPIRVNKASQDKRQQDVGANLFIGNLDPDVDEKLLYDTFNAFGQITQTPKIMRDPDTGASRGFGFVSYDSFQASDGAIEAMGGQFLCNRPITVSYAYKKDTKGERHGTPAERMMADQMAATMAAQSRPNQLFSAGPKERPGAGPGQEAAAPPAAPAAPPAAAPPPWAQPPPAAPPPPQQGGAAAPPWGAPPPGARPAGMPPGMPPPPWMQQQQRPPPPGMPPPPGQQGGGPPPPGLPPWLRGPQPPGMPPPPGMPFGQPPQGMQFRPPPPGMPPPPQHR